MNVNGVSVWVAVLLVLFLVRPLAAQPAAAPRSIETPRREVSEPAPAREHFGIGAQVGFYNPNGLVVRVGARELALELGGGYAPLLLAYDRFGESRLKFLLPLELTPQILIHVVTFRDGIRGGLRFGYRYNWALGHGATLGGQIGKRIAPKWLLEGQWGVSYYPHASRELRGDQLPDGTHFNFPPELGYGLSVSLMYFP